MISRIPVTPSSSPSSSPAGTLSLGLSTLICDLHSVVLSLVSLISNIQDFDIIKVCSIKAARSYCPYAYLGLCRCAFLHWTGDGRWWFRTGASPKREPRASSLGYDTLKAHGVLPVPVAATSAIGVGTPVDVIAPGSVEKYRALLDDFSGRFGC